MANKVNVQELNPDKSVLLDIQLVSDAPQIKFITDMMMEYFIFEGISSKERTKRRRAINTVLLNLYRNWLNDPDIFTAYPRDNNKYLKASSRYNMWFIDRDTLLFVIDTLAQKSLLHKRCGNYDHTQQKGRQARMIADDNLIDLFKQHLVEPADIKRHPDAEVILLRNDKGKLIEYQDNRYTNRNRKIIKALNQLLSVSTVEYVKDNEKILLDDLYLYRLYKNDFMHGGRFYGGKWQYEIKSEERNTITINGNKTTEIDYSSLHPAILYHKKGLEVPDDPYHIEGFENERKLVKISMLAALNATSKRSAISGIKQKIRKGKIDTNIEANALNNLFDKITEKHKSISDHFFSGVGLKLQHQDSEISAKIIEHFTSKNIVILPIHDSYVVELAYKDELQEVMKSKYYETFGFIPNTEIKF